MDTSTQERVIRISDLLRVFKEHIIHILLAAILCAGLLLGYSAVLQKPEYSSTATLYVLGKDTAGENTQADFSLAMNVVGDCAYMIKSHTVLDEVIDLLGLSMSYDELYNAVKVANPDDTRVIELTVRTRSAESAKQIADCICRVASEKIAAAMGIEQINVFSQGTTENEPCNEIGIKGYFLAAATAAIIAYAVFFAVFAIDDKEN